MVEPAETKRPLSERLLEAAARIDEWPHEDLARLLMKAATRLRVIETVGPKLEHIPVYAYHLLRRLARGPIAVATLHGRDDATAVAFLQSRALVTRSEDGRLLLISSSGEELGEIADERAGVDEARGSGAAGGFPAGHG